MALLTDSIILDFLGVTVALLVVFYTWMKISFTYWSKRGVLTPSPTVPFGNSGPLFSRKEQFSTFSTNMYKVFKENNKKVGGFYLLNKPVLMPVDPELVKAILQTDFNSFVNRGFYYNEETDPLSAHLFSLEDTKWRNLRVKMSPTFTSGKMKMMFDIFVKCGDQLVEELLKNAKSGDAVEARDIFSRFTTDVIGNAAFGIECNTLQNPDSEFTKYMSLFFNDTSLRSAIQGLTFVIPGIMKMFGTLAINPKISNFYMNIIKETVHYRESNNVQRNDFMQLMLQLKNHGTLTDDGKTDKGDINAEKSYITFNELAAQAFIFYLAGYDSSSATMEFCMYELALNSEIQNKLRDEVNTVFELHKGNVTYEAIQEMKYLDKVVNESLRKYPPFAVLSRVCKNEYKVKGTDLVIEKDIMVQIPVHALQHDRDHYPDPDKFDPERFSDENKRKRHPFTFIPFGEGPRICIGLRFAIIQTKMAIALMMKNFRFSLNSKTQVPFKINPESVVLTAIGGIWLNCEKI